MQGCLEHFCPSSSPRCRHTWQQARGDLPSHHLRSDPPRCPALSGVTIQIRELIKISVTISAGLMNSAYLVSFIQRPFPGAYRLSRRLAGLARHSTTRGPCNTCPHAQFAPWSQTAAPGDPLSPPSIRQGTLQHVLCCKVQGWSWRQLMLGAVFQAKHRWGRKAALAASTVLQRSSILPSYERKSPPAAQEGEGDFFSNCLPPQTHT